MPKKDRTRAIPAHIERAAVALRVAGMRERTIYETLREHLKEPPSYRDLRAAFARSGVRYRAQVRQARAAGRYPPPPSAAFETGREFPQHASDYFGKREKALRRDRKEDAEERFDRRYALGYLARAGIDADEVEDGDFLDSLESIYLGEGS